MIDTNRGRATLPAARPSRLPVQHCPVHHHRARRPARGRPACAGPGRSRRPCPRPRPIRQRYQPGGVPGADGRERYNSGDMPLLTHDETGAASVARHGAVALAERPGVTGGHRRRRAPEQPVGLAADAPHPVRAARRGTARSGRGVLHRLADLQGPVRRGRLGQAGRHLHLRRRGPARRRAPGQRQPRQRPPGQGARARPRGRVLGRGPVLLLQPRVRHQRPRPGGVEPAHRRHRRRLDDHPAVRQGLHGAGPGLAVAQVQGGRARGEDHPRADEGGDPRELPQPDLPRARGLRHPGGEPGLLRQERRAAQRVRGGHARRDHPVAVALGPGEEPRQDHRALELRARRHGRAGLAQPGRARAGEVPDLVAGGAIGGRDPRRRPRPHLQPRQGRAGRARHQRGAARHRGRHDHHDRRPRAPEAGRRVPSTR